MAVADGADVENDLTHDLACNEDARERLARQAIQVKTIIRVNPESILYINKQDQPMTAWAVEKGVAKGRRVVYLTESGFCSEPSVYLGED